MAELSNLASLFATFFVTLTLVLSLPYLTLSYKIKYESFVDGIHTSPNSPAPLHIQYDILIEGGTVVNAHMEEKADVLIKDGKILQIGQELRKKDDDTVDGVRGSVQYADILIKGGTVVNAHMVEEADVLIRDGKILQIGQELRKKMSIKVTTEIDARGKYVMPGGIDPHTHLQFDSGGMVSQDDFESGQSAALAGGTTTTMDFVIPTDGSYIEGFETYLKYAEKAVTDYAFHAMIVFWNQSAIDGIEFMVEKGMNSFKFFQDFDFKITDKEMIEGFRKCKSLGAIAMVHASNGDAVIDAKNWLFELGITGVKGHALSRPPFVEREGVVRAITLARGINVPLYIVHVMGRDAMEEIAYARKLGQRVIGQPVIAGLALNNSWYWHPDFDTAGKYVMSPPISPPGHDKALQAALSRGVLQLVGTDHCPYNTTQRRAGKDDFRKLPSGLNGIEERMHVLWDIMVNSGQIGVMDYVRMTSTECAKIFNIYPRKGAIMPGSDADVIILNPDAEFHISAKTHHSKSDVNIFEGMNGKGKVEVTIARGKVVWENDKLSVTPGSGQYVEMPTHGYMYEGLDKQDDAFTILAEYSYGCRCTLDGSCPKSPPPSNGYASDI